MGRMFFLRRRVSTCAMMFVRQNEEKELEESLFVSDVWGRERLATGSPDL